MNVETLSSTILWEMPEINKWQRDFFITNGNRLRFYTPLQYAAALFPATKQQIQRRQIG